MKPLGQVDVSHITAGIITAVLIGGGGVIWGLVKPEPKADTERAVELAIMKRDIADLKAGMQRVEEAVVKLADDRSGTKTAKGH